MKKLIFVTIAITSALSAFSQGTVTFNNRVANVATSHVYYGNSARTGNGPGDIPTGTTDYSGYNLVGTTGSAFGASTTFAQLLGAPGLNAPESSLLPATSPATTFRTGSAAGNVAPTTATFNNILPDAASGTFEMAVWDNSSGLYPTWTLASVAIKNFLILGGTSPPFNLQQIGGAVNTPPNIVSSNPGEGLQSFSISIIPEPATLGLAGLGAAALIIFRRRK